MAKIRAHKRSAGSEHFWLGIPVLVRLLIAGIGGAIVGGLFAAYVSWLYGVLGFWSVTGCIAGTALWLSIRNMDAAETKDHATADDPGRGAADVLILCASTASLAAVAVLIVKSSSDTGLLQGLDIGLGVISVVISWWLVHTIYVLRYADIYYAEGEGIDFNTKESPTYQDFAYFAFTIGMTYQVSDTSISSPQIRKMVRQHALLSYVFGTAIIATVINTIAGLGK